MQQLTMMPTERAMYQALVARDTRYEGVFVVGVKTTGVFCRPSCPARKPRPENVEFFAVAKGALLAGYRPCLRCRPLEAAGAAPDWLAGLLDEIEEDPERRWRDRDLRARGLEPARVRRWFQQTHAMTFHAYQRARRLGRALGRIRAGEELTDTAFAAGYESESGFRDAFGRLFGAPPGRARSAQPALVTRILTPLGPMVAAASDRALLLLEFADRRMLEKQIDRIRRQVPAQFAPGENQVLARTQVELDEYFAGARRAFTVPLDTPGSEFQRAVWDALRAIPYGETRSYPEQARAIGRADAVRAVARANGDNRISIIIPCHRVIGSNGELTGYGGQLWRKKALLERERPT
jgi:AraC family transcriptional regulator of adaptative response/methylated-DNA-[protein]-cysteine methyltransferase